MHWYRSQHRQADLDSFWQWFRSDEGRTRWLVCRPAPLLLSSWLDAHCPAKLEFKLLTQVPSDDDDRDDDSDSDSDGDDVDQVTAFKLYTEAQKQKPSSFVFRRASRPGTRTKYARCVPSKRILTLGLEKLF